MRLSPRARADWIIPTESQPLFPLLPLHRPGLGRFGCLRAGGEFPRTRFNIVDRLTEYGETFFIRSSFDDLKTLI